MVKLGEDDLVSLRRVAKSREIRHSNRSSSWGGGKRHQLFQRITGPNLARG